MRLEPIIGSDPQEILAAVRAVLSGDGPALGLGLVDRRPAQVADGTAAVITTSGSTGVPKSVVLSRDALVASVRATAERIGEGAWLLALPAAYVAGLQVLVRSVIAGREPTLLRGPFTPASFGEAALAMPTTRDGARRAAFTSLVPAQLQRLLDAAEHDSSVAAALRSFERILIGGQALAPALLERAHDAGVRVVRTYGSTETSGGCVYDGTPLQGVAVRTVEGEVQVSGPMLADGYLAEPEATAAAFPHDADGSRWYRTGDAGVIEDAVLRVRGRLDRVIVSGGINVSLDRVEQVVRSVPGLSGAVVVGVADDRWGEASVVVACRGEALRRSESTQLDEARAAVAAEIGAHARPVRLVLVDELLTLPSGKPTAKPSGARSPRCTDGRGGP